MLYIFQIYYFLKWKGYNSRYNSWEPAANLECDELLTEFEFKRVKDILGVAYRVGEFVYVVKVIDSIEPMIVTPTDARAFSKKVFNFLLDKVVIGDEGVGAGHYANGLAVLSGYDQNAIPDVICK